MCFTTKADGKLKSIPLKANWRILRRWKEVECIRPYVYSCWSCLLFVNICSYLFICGDICLYLLILVYICSYLFICGDRCWYLLIFVYIYWYFSYLFICSDLGLNVLIVVHTYSCDIGFYLLICIDICYIC